MIDLRFRPLPEWKEPAELAKVRSQFRATYSKTLELLEFELKKGIYIHEYREQTES